MRHSKTGENKGTEQVPEKQRHRHSHFTEETVKGRERRRWEETRRDGMGTGRRTHTQGRTDTHRDGMREQEDRKARGKEPGGSQKGFVRLEEVPSSPKDPSF